MQSYDLSRYELYCGSLKVKQDLLSIMEFKFVKGFPGYPCLERDSCICLHIDAVYGGNDLGNGPLEIIDGARFDGTIGEEDVFPTDQDKACFHGFISDKSYRYVFIYQPGRLIVNSRKPRPEEISYTHKMGNKF